ncbi:unnamed protein product [Sphagnum balticum]
MKHNPVMRFLRNQEYYKFNVGDIVIKQNKWTYNGEWETKNTAVGAPTKYMYVFENELGIGYIKQLRVDGSGFTRHLECTANFDPDTTRLVLDPDFVDHMLIGEADFQYNKEYLDKKNFREEAMAKNRKLVLNARAKIKWLATAKPGDVFWGGNTFEKLVNDQYQVFEVFKDGPVPVLKAFKVIDIGTSHAREYVFGIDTIRWTKLSLQKPYPLEDELCGHQK